MQWTASARRVSHGRSRRCCRPVTEAASTQAVNVADQRRDPSSLLNWLERLIRRRRESPEIGWGTYTRLSSDDPGVFAHRCEWEGNAIVAVHNLAGRRVRPEIVVEDAGADAVLVDLFDHDERRVGDGGRVKLELPRYGARWYRLRRAGQRIAP